MPTPSAVFKALDELRALFPDSTAFPSAFPASSSAASPITAVNLHPKWMSFPLQAELEKRWKKPVRVANDAAVQGYGAIRGKGVELALTLGTGMGSALFTDGRLCPGLELGHHPWKSKTYEDYLGRRGLDKFGKKPGTSSSSKPSRKLLPPSTGTTSTSAAATPRKSPSTPAQMSPSSPTNPASWAA